MKTFGEELFDYALDINEKDLFSNGRDIRTDFKQERHSVDAKILIEKNLKETLEALVKHLFGQDVEYRTEIHYLAILQNIMAPRFYELKILPLKISIKMD